MEDLLYLGIGVAMFLIALLFVRERRPSPAAASGTTGATTDSQRGRP